MNFFVSGPGPRTLRVSVPESNSADYRTSCDRGVNLIETRAWIAVHGLRKPCTRDTGVNPPTSPFPNPQRGKCMREGMAKQRNSKEAKQGQPHIDWQGILRDILKVFFDEQSEMDSSCNRMRPCVG